MRFIEAEKKSCLDILQQHQREYFKFLRGTGLSYQDYFRETSKVYSEYISEDKYKFLVAEEGGRIVGIVIYSFLENSDDPVSMGISLLSDAKYPHAYVWELYVSPECRGLGIATQLLSIVYKKLYERNPLGVMLLYVSHNNPKAMKFYYSFGFKTLVEVRGCRGDPGEVIYYKAGGV